MASDPLKFHEKHGANVRLSDNSTLARATEGMFGRLCFTHRPLKPNEKLVVTSDKERPGFVIVGLTEKDPRTLRDVPARLELGSQCKTSGFWGSLELLGRLGGEYSIYLEEAKVMIAKKDNEPKELIIGFRAEKPVYVIFDLRGETERLQIGNSSEPQPQPEPTTPEVPFYPTKSRYFENYEVSPAHFTPHSPSSVKIRSNLALCHKASPSGVNAAVVNNILRPDCVLIAKIMALKSSNPAQMILTVEDASSVNSRESLAELCDSTYSLRMQSTPPGDGDELAIKISSSGMVYISHNNSTWTPKMHVDPKLEYRVVFDMTYITVLSLIGMSTGLDQLDDDDDTPAVTPLRVAPERSSKKAPPLPDCLVCLDKPRDVTLLPCFHVAVCPVCADELRKDYSPKCPVCRGSITDVKKLYVA